MSNINPIYSFVSEFHQFIHDETGNENQDSCEIRLQEDSQETIPKIRNNDFGPQVTDQNVINEINDMKQVVESIGPSLGNREEVIGFMKKLWNVVVKENLKGFNLLTSIITHIIDNSNGSLRSEPNNLKKIQELMQITSDLADKPNNSKKTRELLQIISEREKEITEKNKEIAEISFQRDLAKQGYDGLIYGNGFLQQQLDNITRIYNQACETLRVQDAYIKQLEARAKEKENSPESFLNFPQDPDVIPVKKIKTEKTDDNEVGEKKEGLMVILNPPRPAEDEIFTKLGDNSRKINEFLSSAVKF